MIVEKTVAEEQEKIKDTVDFATAERQRKVEVIAAEKEAQENLIRETMAAEAREKAAKSLAEERITLAEAERMAAEKEADAKKTMAEATIVESSASGLADVKVKEAQAHAEIEHHKAEAFGVESTGTAKAKAETAKFDAEAHGLRTTGEAKAEAETAKYDAEAVGINKKAEAMKKFDEVGREHEEFKLELNKAERIELAEIDVQRQIAEAQAEILGKAMTEANIDIVGGDGKFLETFFRSISLAKAGDGFAEKSKLLQAFGGGEGLQGIAKQIKGLISDEGINTEDIKNLTISALLGRLALQGSSPEVRNTATELQGTVNQLGMGDLMALWLAK